uniref:Paired amphipathic helix protein Sin3a n=1 Tax=Romanomermis culicivorax TaxID=13658 RepID=A0A915INA0_ROMCU
MSDHRHLITTPQTSKASSAFQASAVTPTPQAPSTASFNPALMAAAAAATNFKYHDLASAAAAYHQQSAAALAAAAVGLSPAPRSGQSTAAMQRLPPPPLQQQTLKPPLPAGSGLMIGRDIFQQQQQHNLASLVLPSNNLANYLAVAATNHQAAVAATAAQIQQNLKVEDALSYLEQVKLQFRNKPDVYNNFLDIMKDFKSAKFKITIRHDTVLGTEKQMRFKKIFLLQFMLILRIFQMISFSKGINFESFPHVADEGVRRKSDTPGVIQKVSQLFRGHPTLIIGFNTFLPPGFKIEANGDGSDRISILLPDGQSHLITCGDDPPTPIPVQSHESTMNQASNRSVIMNNQIAKPTVLQQPTQQPPFEFNQAINYNRYLHQPEVYKNFLDILHRYQKEQREIKEGTIQPSRKTLSEREVYDMVANLFANEPDLLREFSQFLPDASSTGGFLHQQQQQPAVTPMPQLLEPSPPRPLPQTAIILPPPPDAQAPQSVVKVQVETPKRLASPMTPNEEASPPKKQFKIDIVNHDLSSIDAANCGSLQEFDIFDKIKRTLNDEETYKNFVRSLVLYNKEILSKYEFLSILTPFFW